MSEFFDRFKRGKGEYLSNEDLVDNFFSEIVDREDSHLLLFVLLGKLYFNRSITDRDLEEIAINLDQFKEIVATSSSVKNLETLKEELAINREVSLFYSQITELIATYQLNEGKRDQFTHFICRYASENSIVDLLKAYEIVNDRTPELLDPYR